MPVVSLHVHEETQVNIHEPVWVECKRTGPAEEDQTNMLGAGDRAGESFEMREEISICSCSECQMFYGTLKLFSPSCLSTSSSLHLPRRCWGPPSHYMMRCCHLQACAGNAGAVSLESTEQLFSCVLSATRVEEKEGSKVNHRAQL